MPWYYDPHSGGIKIPLKIYDEICREAQAFACTRPWFPRIQLKLRFKSQFCYIDTKEEGDERVFPLCRLRHFQRENWSLALFTYSNERYEPCAFSNGKLEGTFQAALAICDPFIL